LTIFNQKFTPPFEYEVKILPNFGFDQKMNLDLTSLKKAWESLQEAWDEFQKDTSNRFVQDSVIQRFESTYELSHKMLKRFLTAAEFSPQEINEMTFGDIVRTANLKALLQDNVEKWNEYRQARNITSHTYDESNANDVL
jgi:nucleotidyltransferase substrate binding protein (TIGR01987 family)